MKRGVIIAIVIGLAVAITGAGYYWTSTHESQISNPSNITVSDFEKRVFKTITLKNGLKVVLVSDPESDKSAAALNVFSGSWANPEDIPGLAHFLEHMLFLGTEKYPQVDGYSSYIQQNGGSNNAYTANENTVYFFDINADQYESALDRFSQFFIAPLFDAEFTEREINAVHSEYTASLQSDGRRIEDVIRELTNTAHPASRLAIGNKATLSVDNLSERLQSFFKQHYVASNMSLALYGPQDIDTLEQWVNTYFNGIRDTSSEQATYNTPQFSSADLPRLVEIKPRREMRHLEFRFPIPATAANYQTKPERYVAQIIGHESSGSLLSHLKAKGWAESIAAHSGGLTTSNTSFDISVELTPDGLAHWQDVSALVFSEIELIRQQGIQPWIFDEQKNISETSFQFAEQVSAQSTVVSLAERLRYYPAQEILTGPYRLTEFDANGVNNLLGHLKPDNALVILVHPDAKTDKSSEFYQTDYSTKNIAGNTVAQWRNPELSVELKIPEPNPFVPSQLIVKPMERIPSALYKYTPQIIDKDEFKTVWFEQDDEFQTPKVDIHLLLESDFTNQSVKNAVATSLYIDLVDDALNEVRYSAARAGSGYGIGMSTKGVQLRLYGYQDKLHLLLDALTVELVDHKIKGDRFSIKKEEYLKDLRNVSEDPVTSQMLRSLNEWMTSNSYSVAEKIKAVEQLTAKDVAAASIDLVKNAHITMLIHGNMLESEAIALAERVDNVIPQQGSNSTVERQVAQLPQRSFIDTVDIDHSDSAFLQLYQGDNSSLRQRAIFMLLSEAMNAPYFADLRTREQLGYIVMARNYSYDDLPSLLLYVQSPSSDPALIQLYSDRFLSRYSQKLKDMNSAQFDAFKNGLITTLSQPDKNLYELSNRYWGNILDGNKNFNTRLRIANEVKKISLDGFRRFYDNYILGDQNRSITLHHVGKKMNKDYKEHMKNIVGFYPLESPKQWPDDVTWVTPTFNNIQQ